MSTTDEQPPTPPDEGQGLDATTEPPTLLAGYVRIWTVDGPFSYVHRLELAKLDDPYEFKTALIRPGNGGEKWRGERLVKSYPMEHFEDGVYSLDSRYGEGDEQCRTMYLDVVNRQVRSWSRSRPQARAWLHRDAGLEGVAPLSHVILAQLREMASEPNANPELEALRRRLVMAKNEGEDTWLVTSDYIVASFRRCVSDQLVYDLHPQHQENEAGDWPILSGTLPQRLWGRLIRAKSQWLLYEGPGGWRETLAKGRLLLACEGIDSELLLLALANVPLWMKCEFGHDEARWWIERKELFTSQPWTHDSLVKLLLWALGRYAPRPLNDRGTKWIRADEVGGGRLVEWLGAEDRFS